MKKLEETMTVSELTRALHSRGIETVSLTWLIDSYTATLYRRDGRDLPGVGLTPIAAIENALQPRGTK